MPTAKPSNIEYVIGQIRKVNPKRILDVGVGFGKWGYLCRDYLEAAYLRVRPEDWQITIDGVEPCKKYISLLQKLIYNKIYEHPVENILKECHGYDLVLANDVIEHLEKKEGWFVLNTLIKQNSWIIVTVPLGDQLKSNSDIDIEYPYEKHRAIWNLEDFEHHPFLKRHKQIGKKIVLVFNNLKGTP